MPSSTDSDSDFVPQIVLLDEPSAGLDVEAKLKLWRVLRKYRRGRIIIMTTHSMDEAEALGDSIAIMAQGQLVAQGSPLFL